MFARIDAHGYFALPALPNGTYRLFARQETLGRVTKKVTINGKKPKPVTFVFKVPPKLRADGEKK